MRTLVSSDEGRNLKFCRSVDEKAVMAARVPRTRFGSQESEATHMPRTKFGFNTMLKIIIISNAMCYTMLYMLE